MPLDLISEESLDIFDLDVKEVVDGGASLGTPEDGAAVARLTDFGCITIIECDLLTQIC